MLLDLGLHALVCHDFVLGTFSETKILPPLDASNSTLSTETLKNVKARLIFFILSIVFGQFNMGAYGRTGAFAAIEVALVSPGGNGRPASGRPAGSRLSSYNRGQ